jgi:hypothetical protein
LEFGTYWVHAAPSLVYLNSHGSNLFGVSIGDYLLSEMRLERLEEQARLQGFPSAPASPAILVAAACQAGPGDSGLTRRLFEKGWIAALVASTEATAPVPLLAAIRTEIDTATILNSSLPAGMALHVFREGYLEDADDSFSFMLSESVRASVAKNILGITLYGDPSLRLPGVPDATASAPLTPETRSSLQGSVQDQPR